MKPKSSAHLLKSLISCSNSRSATKIGKTVPESTKCAYFSITLQAWKIGKMLETPARIERCIFEEHIPTELTDLSVDIQREATVLGQWLHPDSAAELADLVRAMNCCDSNLIEGYNTRPRDIQRALAGAELEKETGPLALEARAHVIVQRAIDEMHRIGTLPRPTSVEFLTWVHKSFYDEMPDEFKVIEHPDGTQEPIVPRCMRHDDDREVASGATYLFHRRASRRSSTISTNGFRLRRGLRADGSSQSRLHITGLITSTLSRMLTAASAD